MARLTIIATLVLVFALCTMASAEKLSQTQEIQLFYNIFKDWIAKANKQYGIEELAIRFMNWKNNYDLVQQQNSEDGDLRLSMNNYADMSSEEFSALKLGLNVDLDARRKHGNKNHRSNDAPKAKNATKADNATEDKIPTSVDWRNHGAVSNVKNQGQCGGCYSFSAAGALEGLHAIKKGNLVNLSEQQMIDCSKSYGNNGCDGGLMSNAYNYTLTHGIQTADAYEYTASVGDCKVNEKKVIFKNTGFTEVPANNFTALKAAVAKQPVSVGIEASGYKVQLYSSGIISRGCSANLDHAVLIVGYDVAKNGQPYWIVKNSWGPEWGLDGYFNIAMGDQNDGAGVCGINMLASYPTLDA